MSDTVTVLTLLTLFQIKHFVADYPLQTPAMIRGKGTLFNPHGILHSMHHSLLTIVAFLAFAALETVSVQLVLVLAFLEFFIHYGIDYAKMQVGRNLSTDNPRFWWAIGFDQMLHHFTYLTFAWIVLT